MSPRRRISPDAPDSCGLRPLPPGRANPLAGRWSWLAARAAVLVLASVTAAAVIVTKHETIRRAQIRDADVLTFVNSFVTAYTSPDPFNANRYADQILAQGTGEFATQFGDNMNAVVFQVAQAERGFGTVQDLGIERWNDDGSADVIAVSKMTTKMPNGTTVESGNRWVVTATREGEQWKVSNLLQVI